MTLHVALICRLWTPYRGYSAMHFAYVFVLTEPSHHLVYAMTCTRKRSTSLYREEKAVKFNSVLPCIVPCDCDVTGRLRLFRFFIH